MKIIHFIASVDQSAGGTTAYLQLLSAELKKAVNLIVVTGHSPAPVNIPGVRIEYFNSSLSHWFHTKHQFVQFLKAEKPDIVHINGIWTPQNCLFQKVAQHLGIKVVLSPHGMLEPYILNRHPLKKGIAMRLYQDKAIRRADYLHTTAQSELNQIRNLGYRALAIVIPNGIDFSEIQPKTEWPKENIQNILFLSRVHPKKGIEVLIDAIAQLKQTHFKIRIAGEGEPDYLATLKQRCKKMNVDHLFEFMGGVYGDKKWELYQQADLFVLPTYSENFGIVVAEALATGIPVITTTGTPWHELETEQCGWWIELNVTNLTETIRKAIQLPTEELKSMGLRGKRLVEERYDIKSVTNQMFKFYTQLINK